VSATATGIEHTTSARTKLDVADIALVGAGPRGLSVLERLSANIATLHPAPRIRVHLIDPYLKLGSRVWRTDQPLHLLANTVTSQVTMFVDDTVDCVGPVVPGPSLYEWARSVAASGNGVALPDRVRAEAGRLGPNDYPTRVLYGYYLRWVLQHLMSTLPPNMSVVTYQQHAVDLTDEDTGLQTITLAGGQRLTGLRCVLLSLGHCETALTPSERELASFAQRAGLVYLPPDTPAEIDLSPARPGEPVILRGLGLNFFDHMARLTTGRGGRFERDSDGRLTYRPSGDEPRLIAGARRGVPHHARAENQKGPFGRHRPFFLTPERIERLHRHAASGSLLSFRADLWPWIDAEVRTVYYATLISGRRGPAEAERFAVDFRHRLEHQPYPAVVTDLLDRFGVLPEERWDWQRITHPCQGTSFQDPAHFRRWLLDYLYQDIHQARLGNVHGPVKAAVDVLRDIRNEIRLVVDHGRLRGDSYQSDLQGWFNPVNAFLAIGPPILRIEQMVALIEAGVLDVVGPDITVSPARDGEGFDVYSPLVPGSRRRARVLIDAQMPQPDLRRNTNPLVINLLARGDCTPHRIPTGNDGHYETGGLAVTERPNRLLDSTGTAHPRRLAFGVPTEAVHWATAVGARPGVDSVLLGDADALAQEILRLAAQPSPGRTPLTLHQSQSVIA
jgi:hypothetical protein